MDETKCVDCGKVRTDEHDYNPIQVLRGHPLGWYSGSDGELCPDCFTRVMELANGGRR